jgi:hypothetical protein
MNEIDILTIPMIIAFTCTLIGVTALSSGLTGTLGEIVNENGQPIFRNFLITSGSILLFIGAVFFLWGILSNKQVGDNIINLF